MSGQTDFLKTTLKKYFPNMLLRTILSPSVLEGIPEDELAQKLFCNSQIQLLQDLTDNCVVLIDSDQSIKKEIMAAIDKWPVKFRRTAKEILKLLANRNRFVTPTVQYSLCSSCNKPNCQKCIGMALNCFPNAIFITEDCCICVRNQSLPIRPIDAGEYGISNFFQQRRQFNSITLNNGEWEQEKFEDQILAPLFKDAKHIKIYDRMIGRATGQSAFIPEHYQSTLDWLLDIFLRESSPKQTKIFEVYSGIDVRYLSPKEVSDTQALMRQFEANMQRKYNFPFKITLKQEDGRDQEMPHGRYLITDQIAILIERGVDLLWTNKQMKDAGLIPDVDDRPIRDVTISRILEPNKIEKAVRKLPHF
jgi:hypothetical protein